MRGQDSQPALRCNWLCQAQAKQGGGWSWALSRSLRAGGGQGSPSLSPSSKSTACLGYKMAESCDSHFVASLEDKGRRSQRAGAAEGGQGPEEQEEEHPLWKQAFFALC